MRLERVTQEQNVQQTTVQSLPKFEVTTLPSRGIPYPNGWKIYYYPYTYGDLLKLSQSKLDPVSEIEEVLKGIECQGFDKYDLTIFDFQYLSILRQLSFSDDIQVLLEAPCPSCGQMVQKAVSASSVQYSELEVPQLPVVVEIAGQELEFCPLTVGKFVEAVKVKKHTDLIYLFALQVSNLDINKAYSLITNAFGEDLVKLKTVEEVLDHGLLPVELICKCGHKFSVLFGRDAENYFFRPTFTNKRAAGTWLRFGKVSNS